MRRIASLIMVFGVLLNVLAAQASAQGWEQILEGDFQRARELFNKSLQADSSDQDALLGALFLSDVAHNTRRFESLARKLIRTSPRAAYFQAFFDEAYADDGGSRAGSRGIDVAPFSYRKSLGRGDVSSDISFSDADLEWLRENESLELRYRLPVLVEDIQEKKKYTKTYEALVEALQPYFDNQGWSFLGPFKNINGAGFEHAYGPEEDGFQKHPATLYADGMGSSMLWFAPPYTKPYGMLYPADHLPANEPANLYYAHKAFSLTADRTVVLNLTRNQPTKVWLDGELVFSGRDPRGVMLDDEQVRVRLQAGNHHILVKLAPYAPDLNRQEAFELIGADPEQMGGAPGFCLRITDEAGVILSHRLADPSGPAGAVSEVQTLDDVFAPLEARINAGTASPAQLYLYARLALVKARSRQSEAVFYKVYQRQPNALVKTLLATQYARNGNQVKVYETLKEFDRDDFPHFALAARKLENTDPEVDREAFEERLEFMREIALSNPEVISFYLEYFTKREDTARVENFKKEVLDQYPVYEEMLGEYGEFNSLKGYSYFNFDRYSKRKRRKNKTLDRVEDMLIMRPDLTSGYEGMATYLEEKKEDLKGALDMVNQGLKVAPFDDDLLLKKGHLFLELGQKDSALATYRQIKEFAMSRRFSGSMGVKGDLDQKIETLAGTKDQDDSRLFESMELDDMLARKPEWQDRYAGEDALILLNHKNYLLKTDGQLKSWHKLIILVNTEAGVQNWTSAYFNELGHNIVAQVRKADGSFYQPEVRGTAVVAQNLQPGDMLIVDGISSGNTRSSQRQFGLSEVFSFFEAFEFSNPVFSQKISVAVPDGYPVAFMPHHMDSAQHTVVQREGYDFYTWNMEHVPAYVEEEASLGRWIGSPKLQASYGINWTDLAVWYQDMTYRKLEPNYLIQALHDTLVKPGMTDQEIVQAIYRYITHDIQYVYSFLQDGYEPQAPEITCSAGVGDCKDVATLMITLLRMSGIDAYYTLVLSNAYLPFKALPINFFNHAIVAYELNGETNFVDLTTERYPYYALPEPDQGAWALLIKPGEQDIFRLPLDQLNTRKNLIHFDIKAAMPDPVTLELDLRATYPGNEGGRMREFMGAQGKNTSAYYRRELSLQSFPGIKLEDLEYDNLEAFAEPLSFQASLRAEDAVEDLYGLHVLPIPCIDRGPVPSALLTPRRYRMLDLSQVINVGPVRQTVTLTFPEGFRLFKTPPAATLNSRFGTYRLRFRRVRGGVEIEKYQTFSQTKITPEDYPEFREFYYQTNKLDRTKLVFVKDGFRLEVE